MINLADNGLACECGSGRLVASGSTQCPGGFCICASCGRTFRVHLALAPVAWEACALDLNDVDYVAFGWTRRGLPAGALEVLQRSGGRFTKSDRAGAALGAVFALLLLLAAARAVWS